MTSSILNLSRRLVEDLNAAGIGYCSWKQNHELDKTLAGNDDVDLLVDREDFSEFERITKSLGFKEALSYVQYPSIFHYYGLDSETGKFLHLHVHLKIITGESHVKNYHLPLEKMILSNLRRHPSGCNIPQAEVEFILFLLRYYIKVSCTVGAVLLRQERESHGAQLRYLGKKIDYRRVRALLEEHLSAVAPEFFMQLADGLENDVSFAGKVILGLGLRRKIACFRRLGVTRTFLARYHILGRRALNKSFMKRKKSLAAGGALVALTGLDGSGKSTHSSELQRWLGRHFNVRALHVGRPKPCVETMLFRGALAIKRCLGCDSTTLVSGSGRQGPLFALRYLVLAYERFQALKMASRLRANGEIVLCDRYPSLSLGKMDSPRIVQRSDNSPWVNLVGQVEHRLYRAMPVPDVIFNLKVPLDSALERNRQRQKKDKESDAELRQRYIENSNLNYEARHFEVIDATRDFPLVFREIGRKIWHHL
jgi:thymidylate kinase